VWLAPLSTTVAMMEFRIFHNIFCDTYKIQRAAFAFNEYVEKVFEKYILMIIEIRPLDWLLVCVLVLLNWARSALRLNYRYCAPEQLHRLLSVGLEQQQCEAENARFMFIMAGERFHPLPLRADSDFVSLRPPWCITTLAFVAWVNSCPQGQ
jgi:hypothetical protein